ncbi:FkbM family methyltransferase [uncultured Mucilaginibacter sp.]|uniref:FkbM family methyltransferase n=1 Tax=uncultured Mucilaginibacter sp. TaxID=797541 RepID=UPI0026358328|nr:FkbM family methyltransferase [uncultured Mucilaginibacter sp.]
MKDQLKKIFVEDKGNIIISRTPIERVKALIEKLFPVQTDKQLIRVGPKRDGGYVLPDDLDGIKACFSPGVDVMSEFEKACFNYGMKLYMADRTVDKPNFDLDPKNYNFLKKHIGITNDADFITLDTWVDTCEPGNSDLLLQMDIEGAEYPAIINASNALLNRFRIMVFELHHLDEFWNPRFFNMAELAIRKILETHTCVHIHPNNCCGTESKYGLEIPRFAEFTFLRNDQIQDRKFAKAFPHPLDFDNENKAPLVLPKCWYKSV